MKFYATLLVLLALLGIAPCVVSAQDVEKAEKTAESEDESKGSAPIYNQSATLGLIRKFMFRSDLVGISMNWGSLVDSLLSDQTTIEGFWRFQFAQNLAITPSIQLLIDPALNPQDDQVWVYGMRVRLDFLKMARPPIMVESGY